MKKLLSYFQKRPIKGSILLALLLGFLWISIFVFSYFTKVRDPVDPRYNITTFSFEDYGREEMAYFMAVVFPPGTPKEFVEKVLMSTGKATPYPREGKEQEIRYLYKSQSPVSKLQPWVRNVGVLYDQNNQVVETYVGPTPANLMKEKP